MLSLCVEQDEIFTSLHFNSVFLYFACKGEVSVLKIFRVEAHRLDAHVDFLSFEQKLDILLMFGRFEGITHNSDIDVALLV